MLAPRNPLLVTLLLALAGSGGVDSAVYCTDESAADSTDESAVDNAAGDPPDRTANGKGWSMYRGDPGQRGVAVGPIQDDLKLRWSFDIGQPVVSSPVVGHGRVYIGADDGALHCIDLATGAEVWAFQTGDMIEAPPLLLSERIYVGSSNANFYAINQDGTLAWKQKTDDQILSSANWIAGEGDEPATIVFGSYDFSLYGLRSTDGEVLWRYPTQDRLNGSPAVLGDRVLVGGCDTKLHIVSGRTGELIESMEMGDACHIAAAVGGVGDRVYFGHYGNEYVCVDLVSDEVVWRYTHPSQAFFSPPAIGEEVVLFGGRDKKLHCVDRETGDERWSFAARRRVDSGAVIVDDRVVFTSEDGRVRILTLDAGEEVWSYDVGKPISSSPAVALGHIVIGASDGRIYAFGPDPETDAKMASGTDENSKDRTK